MHDIRPCITDQNVICTETASPPAGMVVFGASGDLVFTKLLPALIQLFQRQLLNDSFYLLGAGRKKLSDQDFREIARQAVNVPTKDSETFLKKLYYLSGDYSDAAFYENIKAKLIELDKKHNVDARHVFYLAVPPFLYTTIVEQLGAAGLSCSDEPSSRQTAKLVVEKPFGRDLQTAVELNNKIHRCFDESQIYRIDHYLGKETIQNILMFRFANTVFEPVWNRNYIDHVQVTIAESVGIVHRGSYYDKAGASRDIFQNHMLQMLTLAAMEPPASFDADCIRDEKAKLLRSIRPLELQDIVAGQYTHGTIDGKEVIGYKDQEDVQRDSKTETFVAAKLFIDNWRWKDVPFYLRTGKRLACKNTEIAITFKKVPHSMFVASGICDMPPDVLVLRIQPTEGIDLSFQAKRPGSKICMSTLNMNFSYKDVFGVDMPDAYQRLLLDCMIGDQTLFARYDDVELAWQLLMPVIDDWKNKGSIPHQYPAGAESFHQADALIESDGRKWRKLSPV